MILTLKYLGNDFILLTCSMFKNMRNIVFKRGNLILLIGKTTKRKGVYKCSKNLIC